MRAERRPMRKSFEEFNQVEWLTANVFHDSFTLASEHNGKSVNSTFLFPVYWGVFEREFLRGKKANVDNLKDLCTKIEVSDLSFSNVVYEYFKSRYVANQSTNTHFDDLKITRSNSHFVRDILVKQDADNVEESQASLIIVRRLRHNFFHGLKEALTDLNQVSNFHHSNYLLSRFIDLKNEARITP